MLLSELVDESPFAFPLRRKAAWKKLGMFPTGTCMVEDPNGSQTTLPGSTVVVDPELEENQQ